MNKTSHYMKQFKLLSTLLAILVIPMMVSCGDDDEKNSTPSGDDLIIVASGTWMCTQSVDTQNGQSYQGLMVGKEITISPNGTYTSTAPTFGYSGTYSVSGNKITAHSDAGGTFLINVSISGDRMTWDGTANNGVTFRYIFERESNDISTQKAFTKEIIAGDFQWNVNSVSIKRGASSYIKEGKKIRFYDDGTCEAFHSMETAWRINNGRIETFYKQTNEPMFVYTLLSINDDEITVQINGTLDDELQVIINLVKITLPNTETVEESYWNNKEYVYAIRNACYAACAKFEEEQLNLEKIRTNPNTVHNISPNSTEIRRTWEAAYTTINRVNILTDNINQISNLFSTQELNELLAEVRFIRAYVYYNLVILWGNVPLITTADIDVGTLLPQSHNDEIINFALTEVRDVIGNLTQTTDKYKVSYEAGQLLLSEIYLQRANYMNAKNSLYNVDKQKYEGSITSVIGDVEKPVIWALSLSEDGKHIPVYTYGHILYYEKEIDNDFYSSATEWKNTVIVNYGYWAMLTRTGEAQNKTGCYDYEIYMPIPVSVIQSNPNMTQNPGY